MCGVEVNPKNKKSKKRSLLKVFLWLVGLSVGLIVLRSYLSERAVLLTSHSPDGQHTIEVINRGTEGFFGRSHVRIRYNNQYIDRQISNDGKNLKKFNASVEWTSKNTALITLTGEEQYPEIIEFNSESSDVFQTIQVVLESNVLTTSVSPDHTKTIEIREIISSEGEEWNEEILRYYHGESGSTLVEYEEVGYFFSTDYYQIHWIDNQRVTIDRFSKENELEETVEIDFN